MKTRLKDIITAPKKRNFNFFYPICRYLNSLNLMFTNSMVVLIPRLFSKTLTEFFFPYKDRISRFLKSEVIYKASCWECDDCYIGKTKRRLHDWKTEHFKVLTSNSHSSAIADHMTLTGPQNESKCEIFHMKMSSACSFIFMQIKVIFIRMVSHLDSF